jgi:hypothetical protein
MNTFKNVIVFLVCIHLASCETTGSNTGPNYNYGGVELENKEVNIEPLSISIIAFDPGLPENTDDYYSDISWPELRRAEAMHMSFRLKETMEKTSNFSAVRVTPNSFSSSDLYVQAIIQESNGEDVSLKVTVSDSAGYKWINKKIYSFRVSDYIFREPRYRDKNGDLNIDPYDAIYERIVTDIAKLKISGKKADNVRTITKLRFAQNMSRDAFSDILKVSNGRYKLSGLPDNNDPMMNRIENIKYREEMFIDNLQPYYESFSSNMSKSYSIWQQQAFVESKSERERKAQARAQAVGAILMAAITIAATGEANSVEAARTTAILGSLATIAIFNESFKNSKEAKIHRDALSELGDSLDTNLAPSVIEMEEKTEELTGDAEEQFNQLREILKRIYAQEMAKTSTIVVIETTS